MSSNLPRMDILTRLLVWVLRVIKFFRHQPMAIDRMRQRIARREQRMKLYLPENMRWRENTVAGVACSYLENKAVPKGKLLLHLHGGAACLRMTTVDMKMFLPFMEEIGLNGLFPHYSLAPEHKWPAGLEDCVTVYRQLLEDGYKTEDIILSGLSAGGGYSLSLLAKLKQVGLPMPACVILISPSGDCLCVGASVHENNLRDPMFYGSDLSYYQNLLMEPEQKADPLLNISLMDDFSGYPPLYMTASDGEVLRDVSVMAAERAAQAGIKHQLDIFPGGFHGVHLTPFSQSRQLWPRITTFAQRHYGT